MNGGFGQVRNSSEPTPAEMEGVTPDKLLLKDYRPKSIYKIPVSDIKRARYPIIDVHFHGARPIEQLDEWVKTMDAVGVEKSVLFTAATNAERFKEVRQLYSKYPGRFDFWCSLDFTGNDQPGFGPNTIKALEDCHRAGAVGVGEITDKGYGFGHGVGTGPRNWPGGRGTNPSSAVTGGMGPHPDDPRMDPIWDKCARLGLPINLHMSDPIWSYQKQDYTNDGLMNGFTWRLDDKPGILSHEGLIRSLDATLKKHPKTIFICTHFVNLDYDLGRLGQMLDNYPNLYVDNAARYAETAPIPRFAARFYTKYADRVLYGTDMAYNQKMFSTTFRILESTDEHFYEQDLNFNFNYHWPLNGFGLSDGVLKKVYRENALKAFERARNNAS